MNYAIFAAFLADAEACQFCQILVGGKWLEVTDWDDRYADAGILWCRARNWKTTIRENSYMKSLIVFSEIQAIRSDAS